MTRFSKLQLDDNGKPYETHVRDISQQAMMACPHCIIDADHYRDDNSCRCNDATHTEMAEWGYTWNGKLWE